MQQLLLLSERLVPCITCCCWVRGWSHASNAVAQWEAGSMQHVLLLSERLVPCITYCRSVTGCAHAEPAATEWEAGPMHHLLLLSERLGPYITCCCWVRGWAHTTRAAAEWEAWAHAAPAAAEWEAGLTQHLLLLSERSNKHMQHVLHLSQTIVQCSTCTVLQDIYYYRSSSVTRALNPNFFWHEMKNLMVKCNMILSDALGHKPGHNITMLFSFIIRS